MPPIENEFVSWRVRANCRDVEDPDIFFTDIDYPEALNFCHGCKVIEICRRYADEKERGMGRQRIHGVYGGETPTERYNRRYGNAA